MKFLSICSGIEAASVAWKPLGWEAVGFSEIEPFPCEVLNHHYPDVPNFGDMTRYHEWPSPDTLRFDLLTGGTPCQAFSVAGLRRGLEDPRGNLSLVFLGILARYRPRWVVWENVPGVFSSLSHDAPDLVPPEDPVDLELDGQEVGTFDDYDSEELHAFQCFVAGLSELGYGIAYRTLDAQYFGVPQRRRRPFVVGYLGDWRRAAAVLFEPESLRGNPPPSRSTGEIIAGTLTRSALDGSGACGGDGRCGLMVAEVAACLTSTYGKQPDNSDTSAGPLLVACAAIAPTLSASTQGGGGLGTDFDCDGGLVAATVTAKWAKGSGGPSGDECQNLVPELPAVCPVCCKSVIDAGFASPGQPCPCSDSLFVADPVTTRPYNDRGSDDNNLVVAHTLTAGGFDASEDGTGRGIPIIPAIAFDCKASGRNGFGVGEVSPTLRAMGHSDSHQNAGGQVAAVVTLAVRGRDGDSTLEFREDGTANAILTPNGGRAGVGVGAIIHEMAVRRLTPRECERLQGFPDDYTAIPWKGKPPEECPDGPRYRALGNSWAVPCARWIGQRIEAVEKNFA